MPYSTVITDKMKLSKDKTSLRVNDSLTLEGIPPEVCNYRLGNRSALEWVIDQYRVTEDARSGIKSDPNRGGRLRPGVHRAACRAGGSRERGDGEDRGGAAGGACNLKQIRDYGARDGLSHTPPHPGPLPRNGGEAARRPRRLRPAWYGWFGRPLPSPVAFRANALVEPALHQDLVANSFAARKLLVNLRKGDGQQTPHRASAFRDGGEPCDSGQRASLQTINLRAPRWWLEPK